MTALSSIFGGGAKAPALPAPAPVLEMPDINSPGSLLEQKRAAELASSRSGRASTILSGGDYSGSKLGVP